MKKILFNDKSAGLYLFAKVKETPLFLICNESKSVMKEFNIKHHYETKHNSKMDQYQGQMK